MERHPKYGALAEYGVGNVGNNQGDTGVIKNLMGGVEKRFPTLL
jgi:hypothetical protein